MQRENFRITFDGKEIIKHKWNSSIREIENQVRALAMEEGTIYNLIDSSSNKDGFAFIHGHRTWRSDAGKIVRFDIQKIQ